MNKTLKKIVSLLLALMMILSVSAVSFSCFAADDAVAVETVENAEESEEHTFMFEVIFGFWIEIFALFKYIFYDVFLGVPA